MDERLNIERELEGMLLFTVPDAVRESMAKAIKTFSFMRKISVEKQREIDTLRKENSQLRSGANVEKAWHDLSVAETERLTKEIDQLKEHLELMRNTGVMQVNIIENMSKALAKLSQ